MCGSDPVAIRCAGQGKRQRQLGRVVEGLIATALGHSTSRSSRRLVVGSDI